MPQKLKVVTVIMQLDEDLKGLMLSSIKGVVISTYTFSIYTARGVKNTIKD